MSRFVSLAVLLIIIVVIGALFYRVMIGFFVPVFLAAVFAVMFGPLHRWVLAKCRGRQHLAAAITTFLLLLSVLLPTGFFFTNAAIQGTSLFSGGQNAASIARALNKVRNVAGLDMPHQAAFEHINKSLADLQSLISNPNVQLDSLANPKGPLATQVATMTRELKALEAEIPKEIVRIKNHIEEVESQLPSPSEKVKESATLKELKKQLEHLKKDLRVEVRFEENWRVGSPPLFIALDSLLARPDSVEDEAPALRTNLDRTTEERANLRDNVPDPSDTNLVEPPVLDNTPAVNDLIEPPPPLNILDYQSRAVTLGSEWLKLKQLLLGGNSALGSANWAFLVELSNPDQAKIQELTTSFVENVVQPRLLSFTTSTGGFLIELIIGSAILIISFYFFLYDGPGMIRAVMQLSPLDDRYEQQLLMEFDRISRAIVIATVLSALAQGAMAGIGYYFAGAPSLMLIIPLTAVCALIPFVGPAIVWVPVCLYLGIVEERVLPAILLAVWGLTVVATIDNVVKTFVLHGQNQLHPLLALLSVLGGVKALGPIGIIVGPMAVTLLQTLLGILQHELSNLDADQPILATDGKPVAKVVKKFKQGKG